MCSIHYRKLICMFFHTLKWPRYSHIHPTFNQTQYQGYWWPGTTWNQAISSHAIDLVLRNYSCFSNRRFNSLKSNECWQISSPANVTIMYGAMPLTEPIPTYHKLDSSKHFFFQQNVCSTDYFNHVSNIQDGWDCIVLGEGLINSLTPI